jgi:hypothetical protein
MDRSIPVPIGTLGGIVATAVAGLTSIVIPARHQGLLMGQEAQHTLTTARRLGATKKPISIASAHIEHSMDDSFVLHKEEAFDGQSSFFGKHSQMHL